MKFIVKKTQIFKTLSHLQSIVSRKNVLPILSNILIEADNNVLTLSSTDMDISIKESIDCIVKENGSTTLNNAQALCAQCNQKKGTKIYRVDAFEEVQIITGQDRARADKGIYNVESGVATLTGSVKITRNKNILRGCSAEINLNTGISRLLRCPKGSKRVNGTITKNK